MIKEDIRMLIDFRYDPLRIIIQKCTPKSHCDHLLLECSSSLQLLRFRLSLIPLALIHSRPYFVVLDTNSWQICDCRLILVSSLLIFGLRKRRMPRTQYRGFGREKMHLVRSPLSHRRTSLSHS